MAVEAEDLAARLKAEFLMRCAPVSWRLYEDTEQAADPALAQPGTRCSGRSGHRGTSGTGRKTGTERTGTGA